MRVGCVPVALLVAGSLVLARPGAAAEKKAPFAAQVAELHQIKGLLERADHDYNGHRAAAVREITAAIHALHPATHHHHHAKAATAAKAVPRAKEPQALSDAQLRQAITALKAVQTQLARAPGERAGKARSALGVAVKELQVALTIK